MGASASGAGIPLDVNTFIGPYPFRHLPHPDPESLVRVLDREGVERAWVGYLPAAFYRDPAPGNAALVAALAPHRDRLLAAPAIRPDWPGWRDALQRAVDLGARAIRIYPQTWGLPPGHAAMVELAAAAAQPRVPVLLTVRFEDARQRHAIDVAPDLSGATIRELARAGTGARLVVTAAGRGLIEEVHWGLTAAERDLVCWDISWIWGPPEDDLAHLLRSIGSRHFVYGSGWPLRLAQTPRANLALLPDALRPAQLGQLELS
jgi:hypothetical protein